MKNGFIKAAAGTPKIQVADCIHNTEEILRIIKEMEAKGAKIMGFPELCITGYTCSDLFWQNILLDSAKERLLWLADETKEVDALITVGLPMESDGKLYNVAAVLNRGKILGLIPKTNLPNYAEYYEARQFTPADEDMSTVTLNGEEVPFGTRLLFSCTSMPELKAAVEICEDLWVPNPPSVAHALAGANVLINLSAGDEITGKDTYRRNLVNGQSARLVCAYLYATAGEGESSTDLVFGGHNLIAENGTILAEARRFINQTIYADIDVKRLSTERRKMTTYPSANKTGYQVIPFELTREETKLERNFPEKPFVPANKAEREKRCDEILTIQAMGLKKRLEHTHCKSAVLGISGGLDSTLALLVTARAFDYLEMDRKNIIAVTMPCFGTTDRTYKNACDLTNNLGATLREVDIKEAVTIHFRDIEHDADKHDVTYENCQARERTQVIMDIANQTGGMVIGTGDLSELALGWATYNGDHMSMYGVNASIPKTLVRHLVHYFADTCNDEKLSHILLDVLDTPVSPELLPPKDGKIAQKTEDLVGPYELHDFFLYYMLRAGYEPDKIFRIACKTFDGTYDSETILKWLKNFYRRFFMQQFKRSCLPDGPKVGTVAVSPRGDLRMPSDACARIWLNEIDKLGEGANGENRA
ncbi:MAG: NAD(+) synthase [Clostridia bacterium]|nr:NAD(+) synthase [Clostridia bacterium]NCC42421.1 NAD(+) synthase [Clostridia bacterium]